MKYILLSLLLMTYTFNIVGQTLLTQVPISDVATMTTDELGNVYVAGKNRSIIKFNKDGDSLLSFRVIKNGGIHTLDATNPMELLIIQPTFHRLTILDKMLSPKLDLDLAKMGILNSIAIGQSRDGNLWMYDNDNGILKKINQQLQVSLQSNDMRLELGITLHPTHLEERNERVVLSDMQQGVFIFDRYGSMVQNLEIIGVYSFQLVENMMVYFQNNQLNIYNFDTKQSFTLALPALSETILYARIERERLYILTDQFLYFYYINT